MEEMEKESRFHEIPHCTMVNNYWVSWLPTQHKEEIEVRGFLGFKKKEYKYKYHYQCTVSGDEGSVHMCIEDFKKQL